MNASETVPEKRQSLRLWFIALIIGFAALALFVFWPRGHDINARELSRADGKSRFAPTTYAKRERPANLSFKQRIGYSIENFIRRHGKKTLVTYTFSPHPPHPSSIDGLLSQAMEVTGTQYLIAVEIIGSVDFGHTNVLNGPQWAAAFEKAIEDSESVLCHDYAAKRNFEDVILLIREKPGVVKLVPRTRLAEYQKLGLVHRDASNRR